VNGTEVETAGSLPLGIVPGVSSSEAVIMLQPAIQMTLVSDGVVEAANNRGELFGFDRTREISRQPANAIAAAAEAWGQNDDITVVKVRRMA